MSTKTGARLRCGECGVELVVVRGGEGELQCCGKPIDPKEA